MLAAGSVVLKESPGWLLRKGRYEEALKTLSYIRKLPEDHTYIQEEVALFQLVIDEERRISGDKPGLWNYFNAVVRQLQIPDVRHRVICVWVVFILMNFSGAVVLNYYSPTLFGAIGIKDVFLYTGIYGLVKAFGAITFCLWIVDRVGRRLPWLLSSSACAFCLIYVGIYVKIGHPEPNVPQSPSSLAGGKAAVAMIMLYSWFWSWGGNSLAWIVSSEMFPISLRSITGAFGASTQWLSSFAATMSAPHMFAKVGWATFVFYGLCCAATCIFTFFWVPETKGINIASMGELWYGPSRHTQFRQKKVWPPDGVPPPPITSHSDGMHDKEKEATEHVENVV